MNKNNEVAIFLDSYGETIRVNVASVTETSANNTDYVKVETSGEG